MSFPSPAADYEQPELNLHTHIVKHPAATFYMRVAAPGLPHKGIRAGDLLVVDRSLKPKTGQVVVACQGPDFLVGEFFAYKGKRFLRSATKKQIPICKDADFDDISIWGLVTHSIRSFEGQPQQITKEIEGNAKLYGSY